LVCAKFAHNGFTLIEIIIVVVILGIISLIAIPMYSSAAGIQVKTALDMITSDLEYAQNLAITNGTSYSVVFDAAVESYKIIDSDNNVIANPSKPGSNYIIDFTSDIRLSKVKIASASFGSASKVKFDNLGSPDNGGKVIIGAEGHTAVVNVQAVTGYVSIE
jgi:prepilin-type N-terminal cleavage/methylation domain-containing protein